MSDSPAVSARYRGPAAEVEVVPIGHPPFSAAHGTWIEAPAEVIGSPPTGTPGDEDHDPGSGLLAQGDWVDGQFRPYWEVQPASGAKRAKNEKE